MRFSHKPAPCIWHFLNRMTLSSKAARDGRGINSVHSNPRSVERIDVIECMSGGGALEVRVG